jgi:hypothetical protein
VTSLWRCTRMRALAKTVSATLLPVIAILIAGCAHTQQPERRVYVISEEASGIGGSGRGHCADEQIVCFDRCWNSRPPLTSIKKGSEKHHEYCTTKCLEEYMKCVQGEEHPSQEQKTGALRFSNIDSALAWLREHKTEVAIGTLVVVAGVTFVVATGGSGALVLAPLL